MEIFFAYMVAVLCCSTVCSGAPLSPHANSTAAANVQVGFYSRTCPQAENIVRAQVQKRFLVDNTITPALLRMLFHDSFVRGADASILLDSTPGHEAEKEALPNLTIRGFDLIDDVKEALESACPGVVSCADIIVLAVRDSVALAGGPKYDVPTGRLDGKVSLKEESLNLPSPAFPVEQSQESFRQKGLDLEDMVALLGAHTVGVALCGFFNDRLFNFHGTGAADPTMNPQLVTQLSGVCPNPFFTESNADPPISLDQATVAIFDSAYYSQIIAGNGILQIDQEITADPSTAGLVQSFTSTAAFFPAFVRSIIKMGNVEVKTGANPLGEVRRKCNVTNSGAAVRTPVTKPAPAGNVQRPPPNTKPAPAGHVSKPPPVVKPAPPGHISKPPPVTKPAPAGHISKPPPVVKPAPPGHVSKPPPVTPPVTKPAPAGHVSKPPPVVKPAPPGQVNKPPPVTKPAPAGHVSKPPPVVKPTPPGHVSKPPPVTKPAPAGHVSKSPRTPIPTPAAPGGHVTKPPTTPVTRPAPATTKPAPPGHVTKPSPVTPVAKPPPPIHGSKPPVTKPAPPGHISRSPATKPSPVGHVAKGPPGKPVVKPAPPGHVGKPAPVTPEPAPAGHVSKPPPHIPVAQPAPSSHVSLPTPHTPVAKPTPAGAHVSTPPAAPPHQGSTQASHVDTPTVSHVSP